MNSWVAVLVALLSIGSWHETGASSLKDVFALEQKIKDAQSEFNPRVIGGRPAEEKEFPWMISLHYQGSFICSAFLIGPKTVMTAAHCVVFGRETEPANLYSAYCGNVNRDGPETKMLVSEIVAHPYYGSDTEYDIALMKLKDPVTFNDGVQQICLPTRGFRIDDSMAQAMGWGVTEKGGRESSPVLMTIPQTVPKIRECKRIYRMLGIPVTDRHVCAGGEENGICFGDSGGPLVYQNRTRPVAVGIASFGSYLGCAVRRVPAVYTNTESYLDWVEENLGDDAKNVCYA